MQTSGGAPPSQRDAEELVAVRVGCGERLVSVPCHPNAAVHRYSICEKDDSNNFFFFEIGASGTPCCVNLGVYPRIHRSAFDGGGVMKLCRGWRGVRRFGRVLESWC